MKKLQRIILPFICLVSLVLVSATVALADSPHFISANASIDTLTGNLTAIFKEAGLGNTLTSERITLSANASATYACINGGGNHPQAGNKETVNGPLSSSGDFPVRNGQTTGSLTLTPPGSGAFTCPAGQTLTLASVSYTSVLLTGLAGDTASIPGTFSACLLPGFGIC